MKYFELTAFVSNRMPIMLLWLWFTKSFIVVEPQYTKEWGANHYMCELNKTVEYVFTQFKIIDISSLVPIKNLFIVSLTVGTTATLFLSK